MKIDFVAFKGTLPYASELYGSYQPLLGWKSKRMMNRFGWGARDFSLGIAANVWSEIVPNVELKQIEPVQFEVMKLNLGSRKPKQRPLLSFSSPIDSIIVRTLSEKIKDADFASNDPTIYATFFSPTFLQDLLTQLVPKIDEQFRKSTLEVLDGHPELSVRVQREYGMTKAYDFFNHESKVAGALANLYEIGQLDILRDLFFPPAAQIDLDATQDFKKMIDPLESFDPRTELDRVALSPIGVVHLFRQYFFEFATFLGPSVQHIWLSPGGTVELIEVNTRRTLIERVTENAFEIAQKTETSLTLQDELADAVKEENQSNTKFAMGVDTNSTFSIGIFTTQIGTSTNYELDNSTKTAREQSHKQLRQQSDKVSSEIKRNFKSTFRTVTETQDVTSKRYVLENKSTDKLVNYELRRKMRQVGVQIQDLGTHLCWQTYVDNPGDELGVAKLVHIAQPPDTTTIQDPDEIPQPKPEIANTPKTYTLEWNVGFAKDFTPVGSKIVISSPESGYIYNRHSLVLTGGPQWAWDAIEAETIEIDTGRGDGSTEKSVQSLQLGVWGTIQTNERPKFTLELTIYFRPSQANLKLINDKNQERKANAKAERTKTEKEAFFKAARDRVNAASRVAQRKFEELREEERIVVYRNLMRQLLKEIHIDDRSPNFKHVRHVLAELIQAMFDVDKMLYFVAPEWWQPRQRITRKRPMIGKIYRRGEDNPQDIGLDTNDQIEFDQVNTVDWGGVELARPDNYYITEDSERARLGSSLGWILQLDGDNFRNAFLNAPWVKAVIPIRPGKEVAALNWLTRNSVEGSDGLDAYYQAANDAERQNMVNVLRAYSWDEDDIIRDRYATLVPSDLRIHDALRFLAIRVKEKSEMSLKPMNPDEPELNYLPTDIVYERGFDPLTGGFQVGNITPFAVCDQWVEILPTDQIVAVEVKYNPQTGMQIPVEP